MIKIALTGASGLVGSRIVELLNNEFQFISLPQGQFDITNKDQVNNRLKDLNFDICLHLAAYTNVDDAEVNQQLAYKINVEGTKNVFELVSKKNKKFIYVSTGFVFDGENPPYDENSKPNPLSVYAKTKWQGEEIVKNKGMIVRIEYPYRAEYQLKLDFVASIKKLLLRGQTIKMVTDTLVTPTFIDDIAFSLKHLLQNFAPDIYHLVGEDSLSPYNAGLIIAKIFNLNGDLILPVTAYEYFMGKAKRPKKAIIKSIKNSFYKMRSFKEGLHEIKRQINFV